jgi:Predicted metal binding domain
MNSQFLRNRNWEINLVEYPIVDITVSAKRSLRLRLTCDGWNDVPPSAELLDKEGNILTGAPGGIFNASNHPTTGKPFICMVGFREYHTHPSHVPDSWENYRGVEGYRLLALLDQVARAWRKAVGY